MDFRTAYLVWKHRAGGIFLQSWLNWYSIGLENRHSERISGFESQALRLCTCGGIGRRSGFKLRCPKGHESSNLSRCTHARVAKLVYAPDLGSDAKACGFESHLVYLFNVNEEKSLEYIISVMTPA